MAEKAIGKTLKENPLEKAIEGTKNFLQEHQSKIKTGLATAAGAVGGYLIGGQLEATPEMYLSTQMAATYISALAGGLTTWNKELKDNGYNLEPADTHFYRQQ